MLLGHSFLDERDPLVLIGGAQRAGDDRELALAAEQPRRLVGQRVANAFGRSLVDEEVARVGLGVGVPGQHLDAALAGLAKDRRDAGPVLDRDGNHVDLARDPVLDDLVLLGRVESRRPIPDELDAELLRRFFGAGAAADEVRIAFRLGHHRDHASRAGRRCGTGRTRDTRRRRPGWHHRANQPDVGAGDDERCGNDGGADDGDLAVFHLEVSIGCIRSHASAGSERARCASNIRQSRSCRAGGRRSARRRTRTAAPPAAARCGAPTARRGPSSVPQSVPRPPNTDVPPSTTAVMASSS